MDPPATPLPSDSDLSNGVNRLNLNGAGDAHPANLVPGLEKAVDSPRKIRVVCVGAGFAGLTLAHRLREMNMEAFVDLCIYEKNTDVGGAWLENKYPGIAC
jgi:malic enzyme